MRVGNFELVLKSRLTSGEGSEENLPEEQILDETTVIGEMGSEYLVCVNIYRDEKTGKWPAPKLRVGLHVDGHDVQYSNRVYLSDKLPKEVDYVTAVFEGFKKNAVDLRSFKFGTPSYIPYSSHKSLAASGSVSIPGARKKTKVDDLGKITAFVFKCLQTSWTATVANESRFHELHSHESSGREKKAWFQPSLVTTAGQHIAEETERFPKELAKWTNVGGGTGGDSNKPVQTLTVHYHTKVWAGLKRKMQDRG
jgi:hypothetical protein